MKLRSLAAALTAFALSSGTAFAQASTAASSAAQPSDKALLSYAIGYDMARDLAERNVDLDINTLMRAIQVGSAVVGLALFPAFRKWFRAWLLKTSRGGAD